jgi:hypothetical protein
MADDAAGVDAAPGAGGIAGARGSSAAGAAEADGAAGVGGSAEAGGASAAELVGLVHVVLGRLGGEVSGRRGVMLASAPDVLDVLLGLLNVKNRVDAVIGEVVGALDRSGLCGQVTQADLTAWLMLKALLTRRQASRLVLDARRATGFGQVRQAALAGAMSIAQVEAVVDVLDNLPRDLDDAQTKGAERYLVEMANSTASDGLARVSEEVLEQVAPEVAEQLGEERAKRQFERATRRRSLTIHTHADGVTTFSGSLPAIDGEIVRKVIDKIAEKNRRLQAQTPGGVPVDRRAARVDALVEIARHAQGCEKAAGLGAGGAQIVLTIPLSDLTSGAGAQGRLASTGDRIDSLTLKTLACDSDVRRAVLGAKGEILDIGRATRVIPKQLRLALAIRDSGCAFPGCDRPVEACHIHHMDPWWHGGPTSLSNGCTLCPTHHRMVEPPRDGPPNWVVRLRDDGLPEFIPPKWIDPDQKPLLHHRFKNRGAEPASDADPRLNPKPPGSPPPG